MSGSAAPLAGRRVIVTRRAEQSDALGDGLRALGATVVAVPSLEIAPPEDMAPLDGALRGLAGWDAVVLTSANAVAAVAERLAVLGLGEAALGGVEVAVVGSATAAEYRRRFPALPEPRRPAQDFRAESLLAELRSGARGRRFLIPASDRARDVLGAGLEAEGAVVQRVVAYRTLAPEGLNDAVRAAVAQGADLVAFASPSAVEGFAEALGSSAGAVPKAAAIGPATAAAASAAGFDVVVVAFPSTAAGLVDGIARHFGRG